MKSRQNTRSAIHVGQQMHIVLRYSCLAIELREQTSTVNPVLFLAVFVCRNGTWCHDWRWLHWGFPMTPAPFLRRDVSIILMQFKTDVATECQLNPETVVNWLCDRETVSNGCVTGRLWSNWLCDNETVVKWLCDRETEVKWLCDRQTVVKWLYDRETVVR